MKTFRDSFVREACGSVETFCLTERPLASAKLDGLQTAAGLRQHTQILQKAQSIEVRSVVPTWSANIEEVSDVAVDNGNDMFSPMTNESRVTYY